MSSVSLNSNSYKNTQASLKKVDSKVSKDLGLEEEETTAQIEKEEVKVTKDKEAARVEISDKAKELKKELEAKEKLTHAEKAQQIHAKKFGNIEKPGIYFVSGFDWFGAGSIKGNYDGIKDMSEAVEGAKHYAWDETDKLIEDIKKRRPDQPIILVGHSFGGDGVMEVAQELNTIENGFRKIDLLVTLDSVGTDNDKVPQNVRKNLNYLATGPWHFLNDGPNIALDYNRTKVENFLRPEEHAQLDDTTDIQIRILEEIEEALTKNLSFKKA